MNRVAAMLAALTLVVQGGCARKFAHGDRDLPNFQQVSPTLYRSGQPTEAGLRRARDMGIRTVVNVRSSDDDAAAAAALGLRSQQRDMSAWDPDDEDVAWFLRIAVDPDAQPVLLHCQHGSDRTGYLIAMYRVVVEDWDRQRAIDEMTADGNGFFDFFHGLVRYVRDADVERIRGLMAGD